MEKSEKIKLPSEAQRRKKEREMIQELTAKGFKRVPCIPDLLVNTNGTVYSLEKRKELHRNNQNAVRIKQGSIKIDKLILSAFCNEPIREKRHTKHRNGDKNDFNPKNIVYNQKYEIGLKTQINNEKLKTAIRCYFKVPESYNVKNYVLTRIYLVEIIRVRNFYEDYKTDNELNIFKSYMQGFANSRARIAKEFNISVRDCNFIINRFINELVNGIIKDLENGQLEIMDYLPKKKTKTQILKEINEYLTEHGSKTLPLRKKSIKEKLKDFEKYRNEYINNKTTL